MDDVDDLKDFGLAALSLLVASVQAEEADAVDPAILELSTLAAALPPCGLFQSWDIDRSTCPTAALVLDGSFGPESDAFAVDGGAVVASASSSKGAAFGPAKALGRSGSHWQSTTDTRASWLQIQLERPTYLQVAELEWKWTTPLRGVPQSYSVSVSLDGKTWTRVREDVMPELCPEVHRQRIPVRALARFVQVDMKGYIKAEPPASSGSNSKGGTGLVVAKESAHALASVALCVPLASAVRVSPTCTLADMEALLARAAAHSSQAPTAAQALRGLGSLALASGSLQTCLRLATALLAFEAEEGASSAGAPSWVASAAHAGPRRAAASLAAVQQHLLPSAGGLLRLVGDVADQVVEGEFSVVASNVSEKGGAPEPKFDPACKSDNNVTLSGDDKVVRFGGSGKSYVYGTTGVSKGRATWEFRCETDINTDECLCYGCGIKPVTDSNYESSPSLFMVRGYSGRIYSNGSTSRTIEKIHPGDRVRFTLDCAAGEVSCAINDTDQGVVFTGLAGKEVFPAVAAYSSNRVVAFTSFEVIGGGGAADAPLLAAVLPTGVVTRVPLWMLSDVAQGRRAVSGVPPPRPAAGAPASSAPGAPQQQLGGVSTALAHAGHYRAPGRLDGPEDGVPEAEDAPSTPIIVAGVPRPLGISLRPDAATAEAAYLRAPLVAPPASQLQQQPANAAPPASPPAAAVQRPYEWFIGRAGVDDSSVAGAAPVILSVQVDGREAWSSAPMGTPGESCFVRVYVGGASTVSLHARLAAPAAAAPSPPPSSPPPAVAKTVWCTAAVVETRDWEWSGRAHGGPPVYLDAPAAPAPPLSAEQQQQLLQREPGGGGPPSEPSTLLGLARALLSRMAFAAEAHFHALRRASSALTTLSKGLQLPLSRGTAAIIAAAEARVAAAAAAKKKSPKAPDAPVAETDIAEAKTLLRLRAPLVLDPCAATFALLEALLRQSLPRAWQEEEAAAATPAAAAVAALSSGAPLRPATDPQPEDIEAARRPWAEVVRGALVLVRLNLRALALWGPQAIQEAGIRLEGRRAGRGDDNGPLSSTAQTQSPSTALRRVLVREAAARGDAASTHARPQLGSGALYGSGDPADDEGPSEPTLEPLHRLLQGIMQAAASDDGDGAADTPLQGSAGGGPAARLPARLRAAASEALDAGLPLLYPTPEARRQLMEVLLRRGGTVDVEVRFPALLPGGDAAADRSAEAPSKNGPQSLEAARTARRRHDVRFDRAVLLLQTEVARLGWQSALHGVWGGSLHLIVRIPGPEPAAAGGASESQQQGRGRASGASELDAAQGFLEGALRRVFRRAGLGAWEVPTGCLDPLVPLRIQRMLDVAAPAGSASLADGVAGCVRLFPASAGAFDTILESIRGKAGVGQQRAVAAAASASAKEGPA